MESTDQYNFSIFSPRNLHGRKNRNVIFSMLLIWAVAVFGFQFLLRGIQEPKAEKSLILFESVWPSALKGDMAADDVKTLLGSLVHVKGKNIVKPADQELLNNAISSMMYGIISDSVKTEIIGVLADTRKLKSELATTRDQEYLDIKSEITGKSQNLISLLESYTGFIPSSLEATILINSLKEEYPLTLADESLTRLPAVMKLYLTHNQSKLTDTKFLGFPFHYFYTAVFLLILFVALCIIYNVLIEWRLRKEGIVE
ncbi:MAG: hypothetical protein V1903_02350 [Bacteroidota bacterium]